MKEKQITIYQMSEDSIDTIDQMTIDVVYVEGKETSSGDRLTPPEYSEDEIISIECNGVCVSDFIGTLFSDQELIEALTDLETNKSLLLAKQSELTGRYPQTEYHDKTRGNIKVD